MLHLQFKEKGFYALSFTNYGGNNMLVLGAEHSFSAIKLVRPVIQ